VKEANAIIAELGLLTG
jgi:hypothetical protein